MTITPDQCRAARALLNCSRTDLAKTSGVGRSTIAKFERSERIPHRSNVAAIQTALEAAGVIFTPGTDTVGPGLHLRTPEKK